MSYSLSIDTSAHSASVALADDSQIISSMQSNQKQKHAEFLNYASNQLMTNAGVKLSLVERILINQGPGSFTGLRVGIAFAKAVAFTFDSKILTVTTPELLAFAAGSDGEFHYKEDAQNSEYYFSVIKDLDFVIKPHLLRKNVSLKNYENSPLLSRSTEFDGARLLIDFYLEKPLKFKTFDWKSLTPLYLKASAAEELLILRK